jgi:ribonuclease Z
MPLSLSILGCGSATPTTWQNPTSQLLEIRNRHFLIDCGENTQVALRRMKLRFTKINHIFISHLHGDHYFGLVGLLSSFHLLARNKPLTVYGPPDLENIIYTQFRAAGTRLSYELKFEPTNAQEKTLLFEDDKCRVFSFPLRHGIPTTGFLFEEKPGDLKIRKVALEKYNIPVYAIHGIKKGKDFESESGEIISNHLLTEPPLPGSTYAFCSDTAFFPKLEEHIPKVDLLYHETTFLESEATLAQKTKHSTSKDAAKIAKGIDAGWLITGHYSVRYENQNDFLKEASEIFSNTLLGKDYTTYLLRNRHQCEAQTLYQR